jgi:GntR family transcriptional regulator, rspAB operon transcriptional repressor
MVDRTEISNRGVVSLADQVYAQLLDEISEGQWAPDQTVSAYALAARLGVSRTPVVEALKRLETDRLIDIVPRVGARLATTSPEATEEVFAIVTALLGLAAERAALRVDTAWLGQMDELLDAVASAAARGDAHGYARLRTEFHLHLLRAGLPAHAEAAEPLWRLMRAEARRDIGVIVTPGAVSEARAIVDALRARSPLRARAAAERQIATIAAEVRRGPTRDGGGLLADHARLEHAALLYRSTAEFIASVLPFSLGGLQRDEPVLVVSSPEKMDALGAALGTDGSKLEFRDSTQWYDDPAATLRRYREHIDKRAGSSRVRIIGEPTWSGRSDAQTDDWLRYEAVLNIALESSPASILCPYDAGTLPSRVLDASRAAHPHRCLDGQLTASPQYREFFATATTKLR